MHFPSALFLALPAAFAQLATLAAWTALAVAMATRAASAEGPAVPALPREFRACWIASKGNIDWPSQPGLPTARQQAELRQILDQARLLRLNAVILQVRPQGDALYASRLEPWSAYLTGREGVGPATAWDPLAYAVQEAHARGLELHAWINPFRARSESTPSPMAPEHFARRRPDLTRTYGNQLWLDPGEPEVRRHSQEVALDLVRRYDLDGLHLDDYFYPYPVKDSAGNLVPFPDHASWRRHGPTSGQPDRPAWRRSNVDRFVHDLGRAIHQAKPWVKYGISPFGIWRPGHPAPVRGLDAYETLSADARRWIQEGWVDYLAPQLYWTIDAPQQSFPLLLAWWHGQNAPARHVWPGLAPARIGTDRRAVEIVRQVELARQQPGGNGFLLWNASSLRLNKGGVADLLSAGPLREPALVPACPWLGGETPSLTRFDPSSRRADSELQLSWQAADQAPVAVFALQYRLGTRWFLEVLPSGQRTHTFRRPLLPRLPDEVRLTPVGRTGAAGRPGLWRRS